MRIGIHRRGAATFEMVLIGPFVLLFALFILLVGRAIITKTMLTSEARQYAWAQRPEAEPGSPLQPLIDTEVSEVEAKLKEEFQSPPLQGKVFTARSEAYTLGTRPWDHHDAPFPSVTLGFTPHRQPLELLEEPVPMLSLLIHGTLDLFAATIDPGKNPVLRAMALEGRVRNIIVRFAGGSLSIARISLFPAQLYAGCSRHITSIISTSLKVSFTQTSLELSTSVIVPLVISTMRHEGINDSGGSFAFDVLVPANRMASDRLQCGTAPFDDGALCHGLLADSFVSGAVSRCTDALGHSLTCWGTSRTGPSSEWCLAVRRG